MAKKRTTQRGKKYGSDYVWKVYALAADGLNERELCENLGVAKRTLYLWKQKYKAFSNALKAGQNAAKKSENGNDLQSYIYQHLSEDHKDLWDQILLVAEHDNASAKIQSLLKDQGIEARQRLYIHALTATHFSASKALQLVQISKTTLDGWIEKDPDFAQMIHEVEFHKKNFFEDHVIGLVGRYDPSVTLSANRAINADRGYSEKQQIEVKTEVNHNHKIVDLGNLSDELKRKILDEIRAKNESGN